ASKTVSFSLPPRYENKGRRPPAECFVRLADKSAIQNSYLYALLLNNSALLKFVEFCFIKQQY
ncbi:MAG: hypothetical protein KDC41_22785, partial [Saprospiraceae bacterium]|nr:hypothetical protein [Saprospiraceae bacterium]